MEAELLTTLNKTEYLLGLTRMRMLPRLVMKTDCIVPNIYVPTNNTTLALMSRHSVYTSSKYRLKSSEALILAEHLYRGEVAEAERK
jgi:hypothetical protein